MVQPMQNGDSQVVTTTSQEELFQSQLAEAQKIIETMSLEQFKAFQTELQYAAKWWAEAKEAGDKHILWNSAEQQDRKAYDYVLHGEERVVTIIQSPLHDAARKRIEVELQATISNTWAGWINLETQEDVTAINNAIHVIHHRALPTGFIPLAGVEKTAEQVTFAQNTIAKYSIKGIFVENPTPQGLVITFLHYYGNEPAMQAHKILG